MASRRVLQFSPYPIVEPITGGQKRAAAVARMLGRVFDSVTSASVMIGLDHRHHGSHDIGVGAGVVAAALRSGHPDLAVGRAIVEDRTVAGRVTRLLERVRPEILVLEHPFAYAGLKPLLHRVGLRPVIVYDAHNLEANMRREAYAGAPSAADEEALSAIEALERELAATAEVVVACTEADADVLRGWGADPILAGNGMDAPATTPAALESWRKRLRRDGVTHTAAFVSSAHPPNVDGLLTMVGTGLGFLPFDTRLVVAGSAGERLGQVLPREPAPDRCPHLGSVTFWRRVLDCGRVDEPTLGAILRLSDVIVLPVTHGGGSNLKTAEAILAERPVVATRRALRSFEQFGDFPDVYVRDDPAGFRAAILAAMTDRVAPRTESQRLLTRELLWQSRLSAFETAMRHL